MGACDYVIELFVVVLEMEQGVVVDELDREANAHEEGHVGAVRRPVTLDEVVVVAGAMAQAFARPGEGDAGQEQQVQFAVVQQKVVGGVGQVLRLPDLVLASRLQAVDGGLGRHGEEVEARFLAAEVGRVVEVGELFDPGQVDRLVPGETLGYERVCVQLVARQMHVQADGLGVLELGQRQDRLGRGQRLGPDGLLVERVQLVCDFFSRGGLERT